MRLLATMPLNAYTQRLRSLFYVFLALIFVAYGWISFFTWQSTLEDTRLTLDYINSSQIQGLRHTLKSNDLMLKGLGRQLVVKLGALQHPERGRELLEEMRSLDKGSGGFGLTRPDGQLMLVSGVKPGTKLPNLLDQEETRDGFLGALKSDHIQIGRVYFMQALQRWAIPLRAPVLDKQGNVLAVMTAGYELTADNTGLSSLTLPPNITTALLRDDGYLQYLFPRPASFTLEDTYRKPVPAITLQQVRALPGESGFAEMYFPRIDANYYVSYTHIREHKLLSAAFTTRTYVIQQWLNKLIAPSILLLLSLIGGYWIFRRTERQQLYSQQKIDKLSDWQQAILDGADYSIISTDTNGVIVSYNAAAERMLGYRADEVIGKQTPQIFHDKKEVIQRAAELSEELGRTVEPGFEAFVANARRKRVDEREWTYIRKDGSTFPVRLSVTALQNHNGEISGFLGVAADLTDNRRAQKNLLDSETRYRNLYEGATDGILLVETSGKIFDCNPAALQMFGCSKKDLIGSTPFDLSPEYQPDGSLSRNSAMEKIAAAFSGQPTTFDWQHARKDGSTFHASVTLNILQINNTPLLMGIVRDISARKEAEGKLEYLVSHDALTGLNSRYSMHQEINRHTSLANASGAALILIDLDRFKEINDTLGHHVGDLILKQMGTLLSQQRAAQTCADQPPGWRRVHHLSDWPE